MNKYITIPSVHCFYGNVSNILNYHNVDISEAEVVLISDILNGEFQCNDTVPFIGFPNEKCKIALNKLGCEIEYINEKIRFFEMLEMGYPILLKLNSTVLDYSYVYNQASKRNHYIVAIECDNGKILISDSYIQTLPQSIYQGNINSDLISREFENHQASGMVIIPQTTNKLENWISNCDLTKQLDEYVSINTCGCDNSIYNLMYKYCEHALRNITKILFSNNMEEMIYQSKFSGAIARWDYLIELFRTCYQIDKMRLDELKELKNKWNVVVNKLRKCSITRREDYYQNIFNVDIPRLLEKELMFYKTIANLRGIKNDRANR